MSLNFNNQKGTTLVEVLLSIVILTIVLTSIMNFFPQMGMINKQNENKTQAISLAKKVLIEEWQTIYIKDQFSEWVKDNNNILPENLEYSSPKEKDGYLFYKRKDKLASFDVEVIIKIDPDLKTKPSHANAIHIKLINDKGTIVSENYGYIIYEAGVS